VRVLHRDLQLTILLITHDLDTLFDVCDQVAVLADHTLVALGTLEEVRASQHPFVRRFFHGGRAARRFGDEVIHD
jgi:phospholipid/cholesterol/gamma-HCH transport system ATP-binding protein